ncbi:MAG TPA: potassium channel family protein [Intrasporangium sp.]|nr:potassium channel family protein [Intrasporangium sp.]
MTEPSEELPPGVFTQERATARDWLSTIATIAAMVALYFILPLGTGDHPLSLAVATSLAIATVLVLAFLISRRVVRILEGSTDVGLPGLVILLAATIVAFATAYFLLTRSDPTQVTGLDTRLDALYFTLTTMGTIGYGDIYPAGQAARAIACFQFVFNAIFVAGLVRAILFQARVVRASKGHA